MSVLRWIIVAFLVISCIVLAFTIDEERKPNTQSQVAIAWIINFIIILVLLHDNKVV